MAYLGVPGFGVVGVHGGRGSDTGLHGRARRRPAQTDIKLENLAHVVVVRAPVVVHGRRGSRHRRTRRVPVEVAELGKGKGEPTGAAGARGGAAVDGEVDGEEGAGSGKEADRRGEREHGRGSCG